MKPNRDKHQVSTVTISSDVLYQELEDEAVLLSLTNEQYYGMNDVGRHMWTLLREHKDVDTVVGQLQRHYDADEATLRQDLMQLIDQWQAEGLVTVQPNGA